LYLRTHISIHDHEIVTKQPAVYLMSL